MKKQKDSFLIGSMIKQVMLITSLSGFVTLLGSFVDGILIGRYLGSSCMSSFGLFNPFLLICVAVSSLFMSGGKIHASNYIGSGKMKEANGVFCIITATITIVSVLISIGMLVFSEPLAAALGASKDISMMQPLTDYIRGISFGMPAMMIMFCVTSYLQIDGENLKLIASMLIMVVVNITGDLLCIFVIKNGMFGMGLATSVSNICGALVVLSHFISKKSSFRFTLKDMPWKNLGSILYSGIPTVSQRIYSAVANYALNYIVLIVAGVIGGAAQSTRGNISALFLTLGASLGNATLMVGSLMYGEQDKQGLRNIQKKSISISLKITIVLTVIMFVFAEPITRLYMNGSDEASMNMAVQAIRMFSFALPFSSICDILAGYYQSVRQVRMANIVPLFEYLIIPVILAYVLGHTSFGAFGIWISYPIAEVLTLLIVTVIVVLTNSKRKRKALDFSLLDDDFGYPEEDIYSKRITNTDQCVEASVDSAGFCRKYTDDKRKIMLVSLAIEEMTRNIVQHGFGDKQNAVIDLKLIRDDDRFIVRIRDNCKPFNPKEYAQIHSSDSKENNIGIRLVFGMISDIDYFSVLKLNNMKITL